MADRLTQLQECLDQLATQFYASIRYLTLHHPSSALPSTNTVTSPPPHPDPTTTEPDPSLPPDHRPDTPTTFLAAQKELAHDLILKTQQIRDLIDILPGVENGEEEQEARIRELEGELKGVLEEREEVERERREWVRRVEGGLEGRRR